MSEFYYKECLENLIEELNEKSDNESTIEEENDVVIKLNKSLNLSKMLLDLLDKYWDEKSGMTEDEFIDEYKNLLLDFATLNNTQVRKDKHILI